MESKKHKDTVSSSSSKSPQKGEVEISSSPEEKKPRVRITTMEDQSVCLFCNEKSTDVNEYLVEMKPPFNFAK